MYSQQLQNFICLKQRKKRTLLDYETERPYSKWNERRAKQIQIMNILVLSTIAAELLLMHRF